jgi:hypothetical protein
MTNRVGLVTCLLVVGCAEVSEPSETIPELSTSATCEAYEVATAVPRCSVLDIRADGSLFSSPWLDNSELGGDFVVVNRVYVDPLTGAHGARVQRPDGTCGFEACRFEYRDLKTALAHCGQPPWIPDVEPAMDGGMATMTPEAWREIVEFQDRYDVWARCVLVSTRY